MLYTNIRINSQYVCLTVVVGDNTEPALEERHTKKFHFALFLPFCFAAGLLNVAKENDQYHANTVYCIHVLFTVTT